MFFLESGLVNVVSADESTIFSTLEDGSFFGETAVFFNTTRTATIKVASPFCVCYILSKADLDHQLRTSEFESEEVLATFRDLQESNQRRNAAIMGNLRKAGQPGTKLHKLIVAESKKETATLLLRIRQNLYPGSFLFGEQTALYMGYIWVDFLIDAYWVLDIILKAFLFSIKLDIFHESVVTDGEMIWRNYYTGWEGGGLVTDVVASIPWEMFSLLPGLGYNTLLFLRLPHLIRVPQLGYYSYLVERHLRTRLGVGMQRATLLLFKVGVVYIILNHWLACGFFSVHRYSERDQSVTSIYFTVSTMAGIGYGDVAPYTNKEFIAQWVVSIIGAFIAATFTGFAGNYLEDRDASGETAFKRKIRSVLTYIHFRQLDDALKESLLSFYAHVWTKTRSLTTNRNGVLDALSAPCAMELSLHLQHDIIQKTDMLRDTAYPVRRRVALALRPEIALAGSYVYRAGDVGYSIRFVASGTIQLSLTRDRLCLDSFGLAAFKVLLHKQGRHGTLYTTGHHFGEFCVLSKSGLRPDDALVVSTAETYGLSKEDLWDMFLYMTHADRRVFLLSLFTRVGATVHLPHTLGSEVETDEPSDDRMKYLFRMANKLLSELLATLSEEGDSEDRQLLSGNSSTLSSDLFFLMEDIRPALSAGFSSTSLRINRQSPPPLRLDEEEDGDGGDRGSRGSGDRGGRGSGDRDNSGDLEHLEGGVEHIESLFGRGRFDVTSRNSGTEQRRAALEMVAELQRMSSLKREENAAVVTEEEVGWDVGEEGGEGGGEEKHNESEEI
ncbi:hypothetical protein B484DRAFT_401189, partial [Ochromonadaceae sp. CCMP2298]